MRPLTLLTTLASLFFAANAAVETKIESMIEEPESEGISQLLDLALTPYTDDAVNYLLD